VSSGTLNSSIPYHTILLTFHSNRGPVWYCFQNNRQILAENFEFFPNHFCFRPWSGVPLEFCNGAWAQ